MDYEIKQRELRIRLIRDFNLLTARQIDKLAAEVDVVNIDLSRVKIVDSVGIATLHRLVSSGKKIKLVNPPRIFGEAVRVLGLDDILKLDELVDRT
jgi:ABC-type transporter Mla MlaB component